MDSLKIWVYREGDEPFFHNGAFREIRSIEGLFLGGMSTNGFGLPFFSFASHPDEAHTFFIPASVEKMADHLNERQIVHLVTDYISMLAQRYPYWNRTNGADHFMLSCHDSATKITNQNPETFQNFTRFLCNTNVSESFRPTRDISIPEYVVELNNSKRVDPKHDGQPPENRPTLAFFASDAHDGDIGKLLVKHWMNKDKEIQVHEYLPKGLHSQYFESIMGHSKFCLCPSGSKVMSSRVLEAIYEGLCSGSHFRY
ncbi:Exostosin-like [Trema orientale]|uniref:Exostosin-like n=1 Tax=Trema orientale TaxID=63057 RepID=A0A2P5ADH2_TREOI|nr:Exostosin-like [Trema orientale]